MYFLLVLTSFSEKNTIFLLTSHWWRASHQVKSWLSKIYFCIFTCFFIALLWCTECRSKFFAESFDSVVSLAYAFSLNDWLNNRVARFPQWWVVINKFIQSKHLLGLTALHRDMVLFISSFRKIRWLFILSTHQQNLQINSSICSLINRITAAVTCFCQLQKKPGGKKPSEKYVFTLSFHFIFMCYFDDVLFTINKTLHGLLLLTFPLPPMSCAPEKGYSMYV